AVEESAPNTVIGVGSTLRGTLMVEGTLRVEGEFDGDLLNCDRLEVGPHGTVRVDVHVRDAYIEGQMPGRGQAGGRGGLAVGARGGAGGAPSGSARRRRSHLPPRRDRRRRALHRALRDGRGGRAVPGFRLGRGPRNDSSGRLAGGGRLPDGKALKDPTVCYKELSTRLLPGGPPSGLWKRSKLGCV